MTKPVVPRWGVHPNLLPPQIPPGAIQTVSADNIAGIRVAREAHELVDVTPQTDFFVAWHGATEVFTKVVARPVTAELLDFLQATGHGHLITRGKTPRSRRAAR